MSSHKKKERVEMQEREGEERRGRTGSMSRSNP
jgi:hypothetical protein